MRDPYSVLGVSQNASDQEIKKAYRERLGMFCWPCRFAIQKGRTSSFWVDCFFSCSGISRM